MKVNKIKLASVIISLLSLQAAFAAPPRLPEKCPDINLIKQSGLNKVRVFSDHSWRAMHTRKLVF